MLPIAALDAPPAISEAATGKPNTPATRAKGDAAINRSPKSWQMLPLWETDALAAPSW